MRSAPGVRRGAILNYRMSPPGLRPLVIDPKLTELPATTSRVVLLIHGFNVPEEAAFATYRRFCTEQQRLADVEIDDSISADREFVEVYWPGGIDAGVISPLGYPIAVSQAKKLGPHIAADLAHLARRLGHLSLEIVAHSLGCRLAIETIRALPRNTITLTGIVFQAAAVDVEQMGLQTDPLFLRHGLRKANCRIHSLYSEDDAVLREFFAAGQDLSHERVSFNVHPLALGRTAWRNATNFFTSFRQVRIASAGHSDYWGGEGKPRSVGDAQFEVRSALGFRPPGVRRLPQTERNERVLAPARIQARRMTHLS